MLIIILVLSTTLSADLHNLSVLLRENDGSTAAVTAPHRLVSIARLLDKLAASKCKRSETALVVVAPVVHALATVLVVVAVNQDAAVIEYHQVTAQTT